MKQAKGRWWVLGVIGVIGVGCSSSSIIPPRKAIYKNSQSLPSLEIPPQLSAPEVDNSMALPANAATQQNPLPVAESRVAATSAQVLARPDAVTVKHHAGQRWLVFKIPAAQAWNKAREYWLQAGFVLKVDNEKIGILETDWVENRADIPTDPVRKVIGKALDMLYSAATRDKFRVRLEAIDANTTELYLTHRGMEEVAQGETWVWQARASDPELEAEMLNRMLAYWSGKEQQDQQAVVAARHPVVHSAQLMGEEGQQWLQLEQDFRTAWRLVGLALERGNFLVEERDYDAAVYQVRYADPLQEGKKAGLLNKLGLWKKDDPVTEAVYQVKLVADGQAVRITVLDTPDGDKNSKKAAGGQSKTGQRILVLLKEQL